MSLKKELNTLKVLSFSISTRRHVFDDENKDQKKSCKKHKKQER